MEDREKLHIQTNQRKLLELIRTNTGLITEIEQTGILDRGELAELNSIANEYKKTKELLEILKLKTNGYSILLDGLIQTKQTGAEVILRQLLQQPQQQQHHQQSTPHQSHNPTGGLINMTNSKYQLVFGTELNMAQILQRLKHGLVKCLPNRNSNLNVILQLETLLIFDSDNIDPVTHGQYQTEQERITALFEVIKGTGDCGILLCLEKLCDLDGLNVASKNIRDTIEAKFPGSVQPRA